MQRYDGYTKPQCKFLINWNLSFGTALAVGAKYMQAITQCGAYFSYIGGAENIGKLKPLLQKVSILLKSGKNS